MVTVQLPCSDLTLIVLQNCDQRTHNDPLFVLPPYELENATYNVRPAQ